jgi:transcriptional regulator with XRE-family HTH domain
MFPTLLKTTLDERNLSIREAARQIGISHTTLIAVINDKRNFDYCNIGTLKQICAWMGVPVTIVLDESIDPIYGLLVATITENPELKKLYNQMVIEIATGNLTYLDIQSIINYIEFILSKKKPEP